MTQDISIHSTSEHDASPTTPMPDLEDGNVSQKGVREGKKHIRTGDKSNEVVVIPKNRLVIVFIGLMLTVFLAALDQTIVCMNSPPLSMTAYLFIATALPTIVRDLNGAENYAWIGTSYLLASAAFTPLYGRAR